MRGRTGATIATNTTTNQSTSTQRLSRTIISNTPASLTMTLAAANDPEAEAERERLAAVQRALNGENPYQDLLDQGINPAFFGVMAPTA